MIDDRVHTAPPIFETGGEKARRPVISNEDVPEPPLSVVGSMPPERGTLIDTRIQKLRRAAVFDIFEQLGLNLVPAQVWSFTDHTNDVGDGIAAFLRTIGCKPDLIARRDRAELKRANDVIRLLIEVEAAFQNLSPSVQSALAAKLRSGDYETVRQAARAVVTFERLRRLADARPAAGRLGLFTSFLAAMADLAADPLLATQADLDEAAAVADQVLRLSDRYDAAMARYSYLVDEIALAWPSAWNLSPHADQFNRERVFFETLVEQLHADTAADATTVSGAIDELETCCTRLETTLAEAHRYAAGTGGGSGGSGSGRTGSSGGSGMGSAGAGPGLSLLDQALVFFGFATGSKPTKAAINKAYVKFMFANHPDRGEQTPAEIDRRTKLTQEAGFHLAELFKLYT